MLTIQAQRSLSIVRNEVRWWSRQYKLCEQVTTQPFSTTWHLLGISHRNHIVPPPPEPYSPITFDKHAPSFHSFLVIISFAGTIPLWHASQFTHPTKACEVKAPPLCGCWLSLFNQCILVAHPDHGWCVQPIPECSSMSLHSTSTLTLMFSWKDARCIRTYSITDYWNTTNRVIETHCFVWDDHERGFYRVNEYSTKTNYSWTFRPRSPSSTIELNTYRREVV